MGRFLLDTNIASFLAKGTSPALLHRARSTHRTHLIISSITEAEMRFGLELLPPEAKLRVTVPKFLDSIESLPWDTLCAQKYGQLAAAQHKSGQPLSLADTMIAAHALALGLTLVTNDKAFARIRGLQVEDWTTDPHHP